MKYQKLGQHILQIRGISYKPEDVSTEQHDGCVPIIKSNNITEEGFDSEGLIYIKSDYIRSEQFIRNGDLVLTASSGSKKTIGKNIQFDNDYNGSFGAFCKLIRPKLTIDPKYLYHFFKTRFFRDSIEKVVQGANISNLKNEHIDDLKILLPSLDDQIRIAAVLTRAEKLIAKRKESIKALDELLKSTFLEMFGDPGINPKGYAVVPFDKIVDYIGDIGSNGANATISANLKMTDKEDYALMVRTLNFTSNDFKNNVKYVSKEVYSFFKKSQVFGGELIFNKIGSAGINFIMPYLNRPVSLGLNQIMVRTNEKVNMIYLHALLNSGYGKHQINCRIQGAVTKSITKGAIKEIPILLPPLNLQNKFAAIVEKAELLKSKYTQSLTDLENLYGSLSQQAFKGELDLSKVSVEKEKRAIELQEERMAAASMTGELSASKNIM